MVAALDGHLEVVQKLRARGADVDRAGWTPLVYAATGGHDEIVRYLLAEGADIDGASPNGTTALMMAVREKPLGDASCCSRAAPTATPQPERRQRARLGEAQRRTG